MSGRITDVGGLRVGHATDPDARTGCTVVLGPFRAGCDVRGAATGTREIEAISHLHLVEQADAILLTGGSAFGLAAADGVAAWLEERGQGFETAAARVPIVPAAVIYDLARARAGRRPDAAMGRAACDAAGPGVAEGRIGAGTGALVGMALGPDRASPGGVGTASVEAAGYTVGALVVVNALGDVVDAAGRILAGARDEAGGWADSTRLIRAGLPAGEAPVAGTNTTLAIVATDAPLDRPALQSLARSGSAGQARRITPVHTPFDGDITFAVSTSPTAAATDPRLALVLGVLAADVVAEAIERAVRTGRES